MSTIKEPAGLEYLVKYMYIYSRESYLKQQMCIYKSLLKPKTMWYDATTKYI